MCWAELHWSQAASGHGRHGCALLLQCFIDVAQCILGPDASWSWLLPPLQWMLVLTMSGLLSQCASFRSPLVLSRSSELVIT